MLLKNKSAIVTGCNRGIGKAIIENLAKNGANIWACIRKPNKEFSNYLKNLQKKTGVTIEEIYFDLNDIDEVKKSAQKIVSQNKPIDILVNNAGIIHTSLFQMTPIEKMKEIFEINYFTPLFFTQYIVKKMVQQKKGSIINISSSAAIEANEGRLAYASSKAALITSTKVIAKELGRLNIRVNAIAPGLTETDMMKNSTPENVLQETVKRISLNRVGSPNEIANVVLFLSSDLSNYITGQVLSVDGGM